MDQSNPTRHGTEPIAATYDAVIVGGGHNGLTAAAYLARAGLSVLVLEQLDKVGGAAVSAVAFEGVDARLSRYSYLVSLLPRVIIDDLGLDIELVRRRFSSYTPLPGDPAGAGLLIDQEDDEATRSSFDRIGAAADSEAFAQFYRDTTQVAEALWPTVTSPLPTRGEARALVADDILWDAVFERPIGEFIESRLGNDLVRGVAATDALIGTFAELNDPGLQQNKCFLYHVIGGGTGDWDVPVGGMGRVTSELARSAEEAGARIVTGAVVTAVDPSGRVEFTHDGVGRSVSAEWVLSNATPAVLSGLLGEDLPPSSRPEGSQVKVNLLLSRLPELRDESVSPEAAFGGTFHINESYEQLQRAYDEAAAGSVPRVLPCEIYCHSLSDPSILGPELRASGAQTLTVFALHVPDRLITEENNDARRAQLERAVLDSLDSVLAEPIRDLVMHDANGELCIETKTTLDLEHALGLTGGNIFHGPLSWPFLDEEPGTPAERWGVATTHERVLLCGAGARRGGAVSGLGGHNAAMAVLESIA
ncbi:phytoene desaturase family protein [Amnibacterium flavum]|uniref:FAD-dependent oxidoreductase n=1 Tax=Amnibacterium flavum TaxID=2173173 RepID=A0A2V1HW23_9MICO|nr:NAD(P)/FAD-dependent oxidoreductase [Amnibacterium flavum]PVZ96012.1 hypothetical protein DDQ50_06075 [Amnibacterium flavum]